MSFRLVVPVLFILLAGTTILPRVLPVLPAGITGRANEALSSGVLMALQETPRPSNRLVSLVSGDDVQVSTDTLSQNEPSIALNPSSPQHLVVGANDQLSSGANWLAAYGSSDGGLTWTSGLIPNTGPLAGFQEASDPAVSFGQDGTLYYAGLAFNVQRGTAVAGTVFVSRSSDDGSSFSQTTIVATSSGKIFNDKPYLGVDETSGLFAGRIYVSWTKFTTGGSDIMVAHSSDQGLSFSVPVRVSTSLLNQGSVPVVSPNGDLYVVWNDITDLQIMVAKSTDGGSHFSNPTVVSQYVPLPSPLPNSLFRVNNNPTATADDTNSNVYVAWADYRNGFAEILASSSYDGGVAWSKPIKVNDDTTTNDHFFPWMTVSHGLLNIAFYDRRLDPGNRLIDVFYAESADEGLTFSPNLRITDQSSDPGNLAFIGDYIGIASNGTLAHPVWTDLRNISPSTPGNEDIFTEGRTVNRPPVVVPPGSQTAYPGAELLFSITATDPDAGETLTITDLGAPSGSTFTSTPSTSGTVTGIFDWTPTAAQGPGDYLVVFQASDGFLKTRASVLIVVNANVAPSLVVPVSEIATAGSKLTFIVSATDPDAPPDYVTIACDNCAPLGANFDPSTGNFSWTPTLEQAPGDYSATFTATDRLLPQLSDTKSVAIHVDRQFMPPSLASIGPLTSDDETLITFTASATDLNVPQQTLTFSLGSDAPAGASISTGGFFSWTPTEVQGGFYSFTVIVSNGHLTDSKMVTITVVEVEQSPVLTVPGAQTVEIGNLLLFSVGATNPDSDDPITLSASNLPTGATFDPLLGSFDWTPSSNQGPRDYSIVFKAVEPGPKGLSDTRTVTITVERVSSTSGQPLSFGGLSLELWLIAGVAVLVVVLVSATVIRMRRPRQGT